MKRTLIILAMSSALGATSMASASDYISRGYEPSPAPGYAPAPAYDQGLAQDYAGPAYAAPGVDGNVHYAFGEVLDAQPIHRSIRSPGSRQVCQAEPVEYYRQPRPHSPAGTLIGALVGGVIGNQLGRNGHRGYYGDARRDHATVAGAAVGAAIGYQGSRGPTQVARGYEERCRVESAWNEEQLVVGYDVTYRYRGEIYQIRTEQHPGDSIRVRVAVEPVY